MSANLYDLLDVDESATSAEIRAAWKAAIADLDPTERRFRAFNDAAGVLLDDEKRAAYDAELAAGRAEADEDAATPEVEEDAATPEVEEVAATPEVEEVAQQPSRDPAPAPDDPDDEDDRDDRDDRDDEDDDPDEDAQQRDPDEPTSGRFADGPSRRLLIAVGVAAVLALALLVWLLTLDTVRHDSPGEVAERAGAQERAAVGAENAAEKLVAPVFSYGFKTMDDDVERARPYLSDELAAKRDKLWPELTKEAKARRIVVDADPESIGVSRVSENGRTATVVVYLTQNTTERGEKQTPTRMWATLTMVRDSGSDKDWLLDDICVDDGCA